MRLPLVLAPILVLTAGCLDARDGQRVADPTTLRVELAVSTRDLVRTLCYSVTLTPEAAEARTVSGDPARVFGTLAEAEAAGALCVRRVDPVSDVRLVGSLTVACEPGAASVRVHEAGAFDEDGVALDALDIALSPEWGASEEVACVDGEERRVGFELVKETKHQQGFVDIGVWWAPPAKVAEVCYAMRVTNGGGELVWSKRELCTAAYGGGVGSFMFVGTCDSRAPTNIVTLWMSGVFDADGARLPDEARPCAQGVLDGDPTTWSGGCAREVTCMHNRDVPVEFDLSDP